MLQRTAGVELISIVWRLPAGSDARAGDWESCPAFAMADGKIRLRVVSVRARVSEDHLFTALGR